MASVRRRIFGLENEYGVTFTLRGQRRLSPDEVARYLFRRVVSWGRSSNVFLENGARLYLDVGSHPEYATPECDRINDVVTHDKAGEWILAQLVTGAQARLREEGIRGDVYLFKNNTDSAGNSYGCHENYLTERNDDFSRYTEVLIPFLVSRQIYAGAGKVLHTAAGRHLLPQPAGRAHLGGRVLGHHPEPAHHQHPRRAARRRRALPAAARHRRRLQHVRVRHLPEGGGDQHHPRHAGGLLDGAARPDPREPDPGHPRDQPGHHLPAPGPAGQRPGDAGARHPGRVPPAGPVPRPQGLQPEEDLALDMWEHCLKGLESDPFSLWRECDWVAKYRLVEEVRERHQLPLAHPKVAMVDLMYHDVDRTRGLFYKLQQRDQVERTCTDPTSRSP